MKITNTTIVSIDENTIRLETDHDVLILGMGVNVIIKTDCDGLLPEYHCIVTSATTEELWGRFEEEPQMRDISFEHIVEIEAE